MMDNKRFRKKIGDVFEVSTSKGLAYFQYTHKHGGKGFSRFSLIRVLESFFEKRLSDNEIVDLVKKPHRFQAFCFLQHGIRQNEVIFRGNFPVPEFAQNFPVFKGTNNMPKTDPKEKIWWLWDGEKEWRVGKLSLQEQMKYPLDGTCDITALILKIERGKGPGGFDVLC